MSGRNSTIRNHFLSLATGTALGLAGVAVWSLGAQAQVEVPAPPQSYLADLQDTVPQGNAFTRQLAALYENLALYENNQALEFTSPEYFARKGLYAADGFEVAPELLASWPLTPATRDELADARARLVNAFTLGAREINPMQAARAQVGFDCWIEQSAESVRADYSAFCRTETLKSIRTLESELALASNISTDQPAAVVVQPTLQVQPADVITVRYPVFAQRTTDTLVGTVYFDTDERSLTDADRSVLLSIANRAIATDVPYELRVLGHTDEVGTMPYNQTLGLQRAIAARDELIKLGVPADRVNLYSLGETDPVVADAGDARVNRRVEVFMDMIGG